MIFRILWTDYDGSWEWIFSHDNKSEEEFILDCQMAIREVGADYIDSDDDYWRGYHDWIDLAAKVLLEKGYKKATIPIYHTEMPSIIREHDKDEEAEWYQTIGEKLFDKAVKKNEQIRERLDAKIRGKLK